MNRKMVLYTIGNVAKLEAVLMLLPTIVALIYKEKIVYSFLISIAISAVIGFLLTCLSRPKDHVIYAKEGFAIAAAAWIYFSVVGALPFYISGEIPSFVDALFETVSGFTTTGASILVNVEAMSKGLLFWRSFTHFIGGMGVLVFLVAMMPSISERSIHILRAEVPGPVMGKLVPRLRDTAKILYLIYIALTTLLVILLLIGGMPLYESLVHAFGTAGTGGFSVKAASIAAYSPYIQWVITIFMILFGVNFNLFYLILAKKLKTAFSSTELWVYIGIVLCSVAMITVNIYSMYDGFFEALRYSSFQVSSIISTTGYSTTDFNLWPSFSKTVLFILMFLGGCAGSTAGGLKISRIVLLFKMVMREIKKLLHPRSVSVVRFEGKKVDEPVLTGISTYFAVFMGLFAVVLLIVSLNGFDAETNISAVAACINNVGPGFSMIGPASNFSAFNGCSKLALSFAMLLGRLEVFPLLLFFMPSTWTKR